MSSPCFICGVSCTPVPCLPAIVCSVVRSPGDCSSPSTCSPYFESQPGEDHDHPLFSTNLCLIAHCHRGSGIESRNFPLFVSGRSAKIATPAHLRPLGQNDVQALLRRLPRRRC